MITFKYMEKQPFRALNSGARSLRSSYDNAFKRLHQELRRINASDVVIECGYREGQMRGDGKPYASAKPEHHQVRVSFKAKGLSMRLFQGGWADLPNNVYLIAMTLDRLRAVDRYGCTEDGQQYRGFAALPPGGGAIEVSEWRSVEEAMRFLSRIGDGGVVSEMAEDLDTVYRDAAKAAHPDVGGSNELMSKVNRARDFILARTG